MAAISSPGQAVDELVIVAWHFALAQPIADAADLGGIEQAVLGLSAALVARGHRVTGACEADVTVAINDARLLPAGARRPVVWFHNEVSVWREGRRGRLPALWRQRPLGVFCGVAQARGASRLLPVRARAVIGHGLPAAVLGCAPATRVPPPHALFVSQAYRGLAEVIALWRARVAQAVPAARLFAHVAPGDVARYRALAAGAESIAILPRVPNAAMPALLAGARLVFAPGHRAETFCLAAAEAVAMGVPVVTRGVGALQERVRDGHTGYVCRNCAEMAARAVDLLTGDELWQRMQAAGLATRDDAGWDRRAGEWEDIIAETYG